MPLNPPNPLQILPELVQNKRGTEEMERTQQSEIRERRPYVQVIAADVLTDRDCGVATRVAGGWQCQKFRDADGHWCYGNDSSGEVEIVRTLADARMWLELHCGRVRHYYFRREMYTLEDRMSTARRADCDDNQITDLHARKYWRLPAEPAGVRVTIHELVSEHVEEASTNV